jgi:hypothetical protein
MLDSELFPGVKVTSDEEVAGQCRFPLLSRRANLLFPPDYIRRTLRTVRKTITYHWRAADKLVTTDRRLIVSVTTPSVASSGLILLLRHLRRRVFTAQGQGRRCRPRFEGTHA